jgi:PAS domain S-box-containing protein
MSVTENMVDLRVFEAMPCMSVLVRTDAPRFTIVAVTEGFMQVTGMDKNALIGHGLFDPFPKNPEDPYFNGESNLRASLDFVINHKKTHQLPVQRYDIPDGNGSFMERYWNASNKPVLDEQGNVIFIIHSTIDITDQVKAEKSEFKAKEIEKAFDLFKQAPTAVCIVKGPEYIVELANEGMLQFLGRTEDIIGKPIIEALPEAKVQGLIEILDKVRTNNSVYYVSSFPAVILINNVREARYFDLIFKPYLNTNTNEASGIFVVAHNITDQVLARQKMKESQEELEQAIEIAELGTFRVDLLTQTATYSERIMEWFGFKEKQSSMEDVFDTIHPDDKQRVQQVIAQTMQSEADSHHAIIYRLKTVSNGRTRHVRSFGKTLYNLDGKPYLILGTIQDITPQMTYQKQMEESETELQRRVLERTNELENLNKELKRSNANLEEFAYAASHDMKEPIRKIHYFSDRLKQDLSDKLDENQKRLFDRMEHAAKRMGDLIDDLLLYSHISKGALIEEEINLNKKVKLVLEDLELEIAEKQAKITVDPLPVIKGHRRQLQQLFQNLIGNALKYSKPDVPAEIHISSQEVTGSALPPQFNKDINKPYYLIEIKDNGIGFDPQDAERIFNVFTRLHGNTEYKGTGIGLSIVRKVVENHEGFIWAESKPGEGSTFKILFPA